MKFLKNKSYIVGVLNITPDSFSDGGKYYNNIEVALKRAKEMINDGADIIDIGGESSKPGSEPVSIEEELRRVLPVVERLSKQAGVIISIDTYKPEVAEACIKAGVKIINDITGLSNPKMIKIAAKYKTPVIIMHMQGEPKTMQKNPHYDDVVGDIYKFFKKRIKSAKDAGIKNIILDPGIGFGKTALHNLSILKNLSKFKKLGCPILVGPSRKSFIGKITNSNIEERLPGTIAVLVISQINGASFFRVHDVLECKKAILMANAILKAK